MNMLYIGRRVEIALKFWDSEGSRVTSRRQPQTSRTEAWEASFLKYSIFPGSDSEVLEGLCSSEGITC